MRYFDFDKVAREAGISPQRLEELRETMRREFPRDEMMCELHVLRACMAIRDGLISLEDALGREPATNKTSAGEPPVAPDAHR